MARDESKNTFEKRLDILIFAVHSNRNITVTDVIDCVIDCVIETTRMTARKCLNDLVEIGYLEKVDIYRYKASAKSNELFGVKDA